MHRLRLRTILAIALPLILIYVLTFNWQIYYSFSLQFFKLVSPLFIGFAIAFLVLPIYQFIRKNLTKLNLNTVIIDGLSLLVTLVFLGLIIFAIGMMIVPQLIASFQQLSSSLPQGIANLEAWILEEFDEITRAQVAGMVQSTINYLVTNSNQIISWINMSVISFTTLLAQAFWQTLIVTISVMIFLKDRHYLNRTTKSIMTYFIGDQRSEAVSSFFALLSRMSRRYFSAQFFDSVIVGILFYIGMRLLSIEYPLLLSVLNLLTNMIPFFGPFIGAIPSTLILLTINPSMAAQFLIITLVVQQIDANVLNPIIHGDSLGIPPLGISFAVLLFGHLFGFLGMIISLPLFGVIYYYLKRWVNYRLSSMRLREVDV